MTARPAPFRHPPAPRLRTLLLVASLLLLGLAHAQPKVGEWITNPNNGNSYALTPSGSWESAQAWAVANGANLVTIRSATENSWLFQTFVRAPAGQVFAWIGLNDLAASRQWRWVSGEPLSYTNWNPGEPNFTVERYATLTTNTNPLGGWNDSGGEPRPGIAERTLAPPPTSYSVWSVRALQRTGTKLVDIYYNLHHPLDFASYVTVEISQDGGASYAPVTSITGAFGGGITPGYDKKIEWRAGNDWTPALFSNVRVRIKADDGQEMALIPGGPFEMGFDNYTPVTVNVSPFYILRTEVTFREWKEVRDWAVTRGYTDLVNAGWGVGDNRPVVHINWFHAVQWLNAKSEMEGLTPVYFATADRLELYRRGAPSFTSAHVNWNADGYRLPTEAEWEKAARGGFERQLYITGQSITTEDADFSRTGFYYGWPQDQPKTVVGYRPNGFGLFDTAGNVHEWCWDWFSDGIPSGSDPRGPTTGGERVIRGGSYPDGETSLKLSARHHRNPTANARNYGFRYVRNAKP